MNHDLAAQMGEEAVSAIHSASKHLRMAGDKLSDCRASLKKIMGFDNDQGLVNLLRSMIGNEPVGAVCMEDFIASYMLGKRADVAIKDLKNTLESGPLPNTYMQWKERA